MSSIRSNEDNDVPAILVDYKLHTDEHPFCPTDPSCFCHEDPDLIAPVAQAVTDGLMTSEEATDYVMGKNLQGGWES